MAKKMLIDATHAEETRVVVVDGNKVEEFDFESESRRQLAGNIYLAKVTRVEPSLQAAFVEYGGNRHGFLAFSEIHPDYYQIPVADRQALMEEERAYAEAQRAQEDEDEKPKKRSRGRGRSKSKAEAASDGDAKISREVDADQIDGMQTIDLDDEDEGLSPMERVGETPVAEPEDEDAQGAVAETELASSAQGPADAEATSSDVADAEQSADVETDTGEEANAQDAQLDDASDETVEEAVSGKPKRRRGRRKSASADLDDASSDARDPEHHSDEDDEDGFETGRTSDAAAKDENIESIAVEDDHEDIRPVRKPRPRRYKIQEVIKVRQILLVQVVKEERGNKGAALTTYLSLAGRYCVLMPNTARGGGISRKITNPADRKKLKEIAGEIEVPQGAGLIVRTAGAKRTKAEIKRYYEYLQRLWEQIRELTLKSIAPAKIYEEGDLIKRSIRDLYNREIDEVFVEGERGYRNAKDFMKMIMPSHAKNVKLYGEGLPLFARYQVESYLASMFNPTVQLPSGGYIVIGVTEALVAVDVNSGRATKEGSIEQTALKTNLEAADEVARQLRLRDLAGLIVIDFIDMDERKNNTAVEKRMKERLKTDRARIQVGRISGFGLMEMSRQRLRPGMIEATTQPCPHCHGTGLIRSDDSMALSILRQIEEEGTRKRSREVLIKAPVGIANFLINKKREHIAQIESRYGLSVRIEGDPALVSPDFSMEKFKTATRVVPIASDVIVSVDTNLMDEIDADAPDLPEEAPAAPEQRHTEEGDGEGKSKRRRRRRRRGRGRSNMSGEVTNGTSTEADAASESDAEETGALQDGISSNTDPAAADTVGETDSADLAVSSEPEEPAHKPKRTRSKTRKTKGKVAETKDETKTSDAAADISDPAGAHAAKDTTASEPSVETTEAPAKPKRTRRKKPAPVPDVEMAAPDQDASQLTATATAGDVASPDAEIGTAAASEPAAMSEAVASEAVAQQATPQIVDTAQPEPEQLEELAKPKRRGWWSLGG
ncbi:MAG: Rne/Rng family ribonuclease [Pseudomonadota bacterium]